MTTVSDFLLQRLYDWGVRRIYGYPGDGINGITASRLIAPSRSVPRGTACCRRIDRRCWRP